MVRRTQVVLGLAVLVAAVLAATSAGKTSATSVLRPDATSPLLVKAIAAQKGHARVWRRAPGIVGSGVGLTSSGRPVIEVFTTRPGVSVPTTLNGVRVQTIVTGMIVARSATLRYPRPVPIGVSTGLADFATGTLGARVSNGSSVYALSNNHVFAGVNMATIGDPILQPGPIEDGGTDPADRIGTLADYQEINFSGGPNTMDAAIAATTPGDVGTATPPDGYGSPSSTTVPASVGMQVQKYGRTTGFTSGSINAVNVDVDVCYFPLTETICFPGFEAHFVNQFSITPGPFSASGDSGSLVVATGSNNPVGLLFAGGDGLTIANPIDAVLQRFDVTIDGTPSGPGPPGAPTALSAVPGDGQVALSWTAPSFDGGSSISGYRVLRGTSPNPTVALTPDLGVVTSFVDTGLQNGTTYYYKVSALNGNGAGPTSNQASATPAALVAPDTPLAVLDSFNRANENPLTDAGRWSNAIIGGEGGFTVNANQLACGVATTCTAWRNNTQYGPDAEVYARLTTLPGVNNVIRLNVRLQNPGAAPITGYLIRANQLSGTDEIWLERFDNGSAIRLQTIPQELVAGDTLLLRAKGTSIEVWRQPSGGSWSRLGVVQDATYGGAGYVGVGLRGTTGRLDDFGGRSLGSSGPPGAPTALSAVPGDGQVALSWTAPSFDGGSSISGYRVLRGTSPNPTVALTPDLGVVTSFVDTGLQNGTTYYYKVSALNGNGAGPTSNQASATPAALVAPDTPLAVLDSFNRANENPLTDAGRWSNAIIGGEGGFTVNANQLACGVATTCTAWRNNTQYGPDAEVYARLTTLPGVNNVIRLNVRLQNPGAAPITGYLIRANQLSGTDEIWLERFDNGSAIRLQTIPQELVAGDTLLLRAKGTSIEVWRQPSGGSWSRLGVVQDATYGGAGYVGVGLRGTTGRLDDFGGRTLGLAPPTAPSAPQGLGATPANNQVTLNWSAPSSNGGSALTTYTVYRSLTSGGATTTLTSAPYLSTSLVDSTAVNGTTYYYKVTASNAVGESLPSNEVSAQPVAPASAPSAPQGLGATPANNQVTLNWSAPSSNGGSALTTYTVYRSLTSGGATTTLTSAPYLSTSLVDSTAVNGTTYYYKVTASNAVGESLPSNEVSAQPVAPASAPSAPQGLGATPANNQVTLNWSAPSSNGGSALTTYTVYRSLTSGGATTTLTSAPYLSTSLVDSTAVNGTTYYYKVTASNAVGESLPSNEVSAQPVAPASAPSAPQGLGATPANNQVTLNWSAPSSNGGSALTTYTVYRSLTSGGATTTLTSAPYLSTSLVDSTAVNGTTYYYKVTASNAVGESLPSNEVSAQPVAPASAPSAPQGLGATPANNQVTLNWSAPSSNGGSALTTYTVYRSLTSGGATTTLTSAPYLSTSLVDSTAVNGTTYYYKVTASNAVGESLPSNEAVATPQLPPKPLYFTLLNGGTVGGVTVADEDVVFFNGAATFSLSFDGSDVGLASRRLDAFGWLDNDSLLFSMDTDGATLPGVAGTIDDSDVVRFDASSLGSTTAGTFSMYFDGSDVGLTTSGEDVDAFELLSNGKLVLSTAGSVSVTGVSGGEEDLLAFTPSSLGSTTSGTYAMYFDGSDVGLSNSNENVDAAAVDAAGRIYLSTTGNFSVTGRSGADEDVFVFTPTTLGSSTSGSYSPSLYFDGSAFGLGGNDVFAIDLPPGA